MLCGWVCVGGVCHGVTPGPFSNPVAKVVCADGTAPGGVWESRSLPAQSFFLKHNSGGWVPVFSLVFAGGGEPTHFFMPKTWGTGVGVVGWCVARGKPHNKTTDRALFCFGIDGMLVRVLWMPVLSSFLRLNLRC